MKPSFIIECLDCETKYIAAPYLRTYREEHSDFQETSLDSEFQVEWRSIAQ